VCVLSRFFKSNLLLSYSLSFSVFLHDASLVIIFPIMHLRYAFFVNLLRASRYGDVGRYDDRVFSSATLHARGHDL
jgi:hypothetical protein